MTVRSILEAAFISFNQCFKTVLLDLIWRSVWVACGLLSLLFYWIVFVSRLQSLEWQGPDLGARNPMMMLVALQAFWNSEGIFLVSLAAAVVVGLVILWILLEALFRGGVQRFWPYFLTGVARVVFLTIVGVFFLGLAARDETWGTAVIGLVTMPAMWFSLALMETVIRREATSLMATDFLKLAGVVGPILLLEVFVAFLLWGTASLVLLGAAGTWIVLAGILMVFVLLIWMVVHSYLIAVRYAAVDIMRRNVVGS